MIVTVTPNPSVDMAYPLDDFQTDRVNRAKEVYKTPGGKGLNVARVIKLLDYPVMATGFLGGSLGEWIEKALKTDGIEPNFQKIHGETRNCISIFHRGKQTEILESGPSVNEGDVQGLLERLKLFAGDAKVITMSGSLPPGVDHDFYRRLLEAFQSEHTPCIVDTSGKTLRETLSHQVKPFAIKPNQEELERLFGRSLKVKDIPKSIMDSSLKTIPVILVSLGAHGALAKWGKDWYRLTVPKIEAVSPVGSGDATVAGLAKGIAQEQSPEETLKLAMACGVLNALEERTGYIDPGKLEQTLQEIHLEKLEE